MIRPTHSHLLVCPCAYDFHHNQGKDLNRCSDNTQRFGTIRNAGSFHALHLLVLILHSLLAQILSPKTRLFCHGHEHGNQGVGNVVGSKRCDKRNGQVAQILPLSTEMEGNLIPFRHPEQEEEGNDVEHEQNRSLGLHEINPWTEQTGNNNTS